MDKKIIHQFLANRKALTPCNGKIPIKNNWTKKICPIPELMAHNGNIGWVIGRKNLVIDMDSRNGGEESYKKLCNDLNIHLEETVQTPSGGFHIYLDIPTRYIGQKLHKNLKKYPGIDFLSKGSHCLIPSSINNGIEYKWCNAAKMFETNVAPQQLIDLILRNVSTKDLKSTKDDALEDEDNPFAGLNLKLVDWPETRVLQLLDGLNPSCNYEEWLKIGMALHDWDSKLGLDLWENWSKKGSNYESGLTQKKWASFSKGDGISFGTLVHLASDTLDLQKKDKVKVFIDQIKSASENSLELEIAPLIRKENFEKIEKEKIVKTISSRYKELLGFSIPLSDIRKMVTPKERFIDINSEKLLLDENLSWVKEWIYVETLKVFISTKHRHTVNMEGFNLINGKYVPITTGESKPSAYKFCADRGLIQTVFGTMYVPYMKEKVFTMEGRSYYNTFDPNTVPLPASEISLEAKEFIRKIIQHIKYVFNKHPEYSRIFLDWLTFQIQKAGQKLPWAPVIISIDGIGKTFFSVLLKAICGNENVGIVNSSALKEDFTSWAEGVHINFIEEVRVIGENRYTIINNLKTYITDPDVKIRRMRTDAYHIKNVTNYACFSNFKDCLPLNDVDRRWWVIFNEYQNIKEFEQEIGKNHEEYFNDLYTKIHTYTPEIRKFFLDRKISEDFLALKRAPESVYKNSMILSDKIMMDGYDEIKDLLEEGDLFYNQEIIHLPSLFEALETKNKIFINDNRKRIYMLKFMGYTPNDARVFIDGKFVRFWTKRAICRNELKSLLNLE